MLPRIGIMHLPEELVTRPVFSFNTAERQCYQQYPIWGEMALNNTEGLNNVAKIVRHHQEHVDGNGYPDGLADKEIPLISKIIAAVGDLYNGRLEMNLSGVEDARNYISIRKGKKYDAEVTEAFCKVAINFDKKPVRPLSLKSSELRQGMVLERDIEASCGMLLLDRGIQL